MAVTGDRNLTWFATLDSKALITAINGAKRRVVLAAPGVWEPVADALVIANKRLDAGSVKVVLDARAHTARLGFGEFVAIDKLRKAGVEVRNHTGLRIGILICDNTGWSFAMPAALVEDYPAANTDAFNAVALTAAQVEALAAELPGCETTAPGPTATDGLGVPLRPAVGEDPITDEELKLERNALEVAPPQVFDLARQTSVYAALILFVELEFEGAQLQLRTIQLPTYLSTVVSSDKALKERVRTSLRILDGINRPELLGDIVYEVDELRKGYLPSVGRSGRILLKSKKNEFENRIIGIRKKLDQRKKLLREEMQATIDNVIESITPALADALLQSPPAVFSGRYKHTKEDANSFVARELRNKCPKVEAIVSSIALYVDFKDVTYETLSDPEFDKKVKELLPESVFRDAKLLTVQTAVLANNAD